MIYIDPPYNTGSDSFVYRDDYGESKADYEKRAGRKDAGGYLNKLDAFRKNLPLAAAVERRETSDKIPFYAVDGGRLIYALDGIGETLLEEIEILKPQAFGALGSLLGDERLVNWKLRLKDANIEFNVI